MAELLILGNGISRLLHDRFIETWAGEVWGCNRVFIERDIAPKLSVLAGHVDLIREAIEYRESHGLKFRVFGGHQGSEKEATIPGEMRKDSGTALVAQGLQDGYDMVFVCGFDIGGPDIYSPLNHTTFRKQSWVRRWRAIFTRYGHERVQFVGYDHKEYLLSSRGDHKYMALYTKRLPHIPDPDYLALFTLIYGGDDQKAAAQLARRMSVATLRKVGRMRGIENAASMTRRELIVYLCEHPSRSLKDRHALS